MKPRLVKSNDRVLAGVCGGVADFFGWDHRPIRTLTLFSVFLGGAGLAAYAALCYLMPEETDRRFDLNDFRAQ